MTERLTHTHTHTQGRDAPDSRQVSGVKRCISPHRTGHAVARSAEPHFPDLQVPRGPQCSSLLAEQAGILADLPFALLIALSQSFFLPTSLSLFLILLACASHLETTAKCWPACQVKIAENSSTFLSRLFEILGEIRSVFQAWIPVVCPGLPEVCCCNYFSD